MTCTVHKVLGALALGGLGLTTFGVQPTAVWAQAPNAAQATVQTGPVSRIGYVSTDRILRESTPAKAAEAKLESEFKRRDQELQTLANTLRSQVQQLEKDAPVLSQTEGVRRQRDLADLDADLQRKRRDFQEDYNRRRNEEYSAIIEKADAAIKKIADEQGFDLIVQDAVYVSARVDITEQVLRTLGK